MKKELILLSIFVIVASFSVVALAGDYETDKIPLTSSTTQTTTSKYEADKTTTSQTDSHTTTKRNTGYEHIAGEAIMENIIKPTCTEDGFYELVTYCDLCGEEISREPKTIKSLGHLFAVSSFKNDIATITCKREGCTQTKALTFADYYNTIINNDSSALDATNDKFINAKDFAKLFKEQNK